LRDTLGMILLGWRNNRVLPYVRGRLLDIGCGTNRLVRSYVGEGLGVDVYQWGGVDLVIKDSANLPFKNESFDTVTVVAALNHIPNRNEVIAEANRVLKKDGRIIITMIPPRISKLWHFLRKPWDIDQKERGMKDGEAYGLSRKEVHSLLSEAKFDILFEKPFMLWINCITIARKKEHIERGL